MATKSLTMGSAVIGPTAWRNNTSKLIKSAQDTMFRSDKTREQGRYLDPLPNLRETVAELSNNEAQSHFRQTRVVVCKLRESLIDTNEEIKSLTRGKEALEKAIENVRKDVQLNLDSQDIRKSRPQREKDHDGADDMLKAEKQNLLNQKSGLETQLRLVQQQLQTLDKARKRLAAVISERSRVLDLVCYAVPSGSVSARMSRSSLRGSSLRPTASADFGRTGESRMDTGGAPDPLGAFTPEVEAALQEAADARQRSSGLRRDLNDAIGRTDRLQKATHQSVNDGLSGKLAETVSLKQNLDMASGENRNAINRSQRYYNQTEKAWNYTRGPLSYSDLGARERLDRPIIKTFQRHPGTNLPEAQEIVKGGDGLLQSLRSTAQNIGHLRLTQLHLQQDSLDKKSAIDVDSAIIRMRRKKANHRWVPGQAY